MASTCQQSTVSTPPGGNSAPHPGSLHFPPVVSLWPRNPECHSEETTVTVLIEVTGHSVTFFTGLLWVLLLLLCPAFGFVSIGCSVTSQQEKPSSPPANPFPCTMHAASHKAPSRLSQTPGKPPPRCSGAVTLGSLAVLCARQSCPD